MFRFPVTCICFCLFFFTSRAASFKPNGNDSAGIFNMYEDTLKVLQYNKIAEHATDRQKMDANKRFSDMLQKVLSLPGSFNYPFDSLTTTGRLTSPDKQFRIITWDVPKENGTFFYSGFIQSLNPKTKQYMLYALQDRSEEITASREAVCTPERWLGMLYYKIIPEIYGNKTIYMMLAWQGYNNLITQKVIDVLTISDKGEPSFGMPVFKKPPPGYRGSVKRLIFRYSANAYMSLTYNSKKNIIIFDHLAPLSAELSGQYQYYAPSFSVDCLTYKPTGWQFVGDIDARNASNAGDKNYIDPSKHGPDVSKKNHDFNDHSLYNPNK